MSRTDHHTPREHWATRDVVRHGFGELGLSRRGLATYATRLERRARAALRIHVTLLRQVHRAGSDIEALPEPDARTRHGAHWDFW